MSTNEVEFDVISAYESILKLMSKDGTKRKNKELPSEGVQGFQRGVYYTLNRSPDLASRAFEEAEGIFRTAGEEFLTRYCKAMKLKCEGSEKAIRQNYGDAAQDLTCAKLQLEGLRGEIRSKEVRQALANEIADTESLALFYEAMSCAVSRDYESASKRLQEIVEKIEKASRSLDGKSPGGILNRGLKLFFSAYSKLTKAEYVAATKPGEAITLSQGASAEFRSAAEEFLKVNMATSVALSEQSTMMAIQIIPRYIDHYNTVAQSLNEATKLRLELDQYKQMIGDALRMGPNININQAIQQVQENKVIVNNVEQVVKENLKDLLKELVKLSTEEEEARDLQGEVAEILKENGPSFLQKAKLTLPKIYRFAQEVGEKAAPWLPVLQVALKLLQGVPT